jgi:hypothetical protein
MKNSVLLLIAFCALLTADTLLVPSEYPSIQSAISASQDGDTVLVSPGEYGGPISFQGKNIVVMSTNGADDTLIRTFMDFHCVSFTGGEDSTAVLQGFTLRNQISDGAASGKQEMVDYGGGIYITNSSPTIQNNIIKDCLANTGAGVYLENSSMFMTDCTVYNNNTWVYGGGLFIGSSNENDPPCIIDCTITNNEAQYGGGLYIMGDTAVVINNNISDNYSDHDGGGIGISSTNVLLCSNYISGNDGGRGGGVFIGGAITTITGNLITDNYGGLGGGIYEASSGTIPIVNNTITLNAASRGGGLSSAKDSIYIANTIFWENSAVEMGSQISLPASTNESSTYISYCDIQYGQDSIRIDPLATLYWGPGNIDIDPQFETGPLGDYHLSWGSPCIDAGNPDWEYNDPEDPFNPGYALWPAMGTTRNDMGAFGGSGVNYWLSVEEEESSPPESGLVLKSFPNPFSTSCTVCYQLDEASHVVLSVFDLSGRLVETFVDEVVPAGMYSEYLDGSGLCSGMYLIRLVAGEHAASRRCIIIRDN